MHDGKIILLIMLTSTLAACSLIGGKHEAHNQSNVVTSSPQNLQQNEAEKLGVVAQTPAEETATTTATPLATEPPKTYEPEPANQQPIVAVALPKPSAPEPVHIGRQGLVLTMDYQQAWSRTAKALSQAGYPVMEQDNTSGTYYILDKIGTGGVIKRDTPIYQLHLEKTADNKTVATLNNAQNQPADDAVVQRILGALKNKIGA